MTEWGVVLVIVTLAGLGGAIINPILKLNTSITTLIVTMENTSESLKQLTQANTSSHKRMQGEIDKHDIKISDHEVRITVLEKEKNNEK